MSVEATLSQSRAATARGGPQPWVVGAGALLLGLAVIFLWTHHGWRQGALLMIGAALGLTLYHAAFGFTAAYRRFVRERDGAGMLAQILMLAVATLVFVPMLGAGEVLGRPVAGALAPLGTSVAVGAFLFGIGMQLGGGCASGTLYTVGGGNTRMLITLAAFIAGTVIATHHLHWWLDQPSLGTVSLLAAWGWPAALAAQLALLAGLAVIVRAFARTRPRRNAPALVPAALWWRGPWPLWVGAVGLALLNALTLIVAGHPWTVTWGFTLWGGQAAAALGVDVGAWPFWADGRWLASPILGDAISVMNIGIVLGAAVAAGLAGRFAPDGRIGARPALAAVLGGLLLGYGARLAFGCNIGAFFSGVASTSLHGWAWILFALAGTLIGVRLRPCFALGR